MKKHFEKVLKEMFPYVEKEHIKRTANLLLERIYTNGSTKKEKKENDYYPVIIEDFILNLKLPTEISNKKLRNELNENGRYSDKMLKIYVNKICAKNNIEIRDRNSNGSRSIILFKKENLSLSKLGEFFKGKNIE